MTNKKKSGKKQFFFLLADSSSEELAELLASDSDCAIEEIYDNDNTTDNIKPGTFVLVKHVTKKKFNKFYVGEVTVVKDKSYQVKFIRKVKESTASFTVHFLRKKTRITSRSTILCLFWENLFQ